jgi:hypothetical protein
MHTVKLILITTFMICSAEVFSQSTPKSVTYFVEPVLTDSASTLFIPVRRDEPTRAAGKFVWGYNYYVNIVAYNFRTDTYRNLFEHDTFIAAFHHDYYNDRTKRDNITPNWVFLLVRDKDTNNNGKIDDHDPNVLFAVSTDGQILKKLTDETENVVSMNGYAREGFIMVKVQKDSNKDRSFKIEDREFYFRKVNLSDLSLGNRIELQ